MIQRFATGKKVPSNEEIALYKKFKELHTPLLILIIILSVMGFFALYSAANGSFEPWAAKQIMRFLLAFPVMILIAVIDIRIWLRYAYFLYGIGLLLLLLVSVMGYVGMGRKGG